MDDLTEPLICRRCGVAPGTERYYITNPRPCLSGQQPKALAKQTIGCDPCWDEFTSSPEYQAVLAQVVR